MDGDFDDYIFREHPDYSVQLGELAANEGLSLHDIRLALRYTFHLIKRNPASFDQVALTEFGSLHVAKTLPYIVGDGAYVPALQLTYHVIDDEQTIELVKIERRRDAEAPA